MHMQPAGILSMHMQSRTPLTRGPFAVCCWYRAFYTCIREDYVSAVLADIRVCVHAFGPQKAVCPTSACTSKIQVQTVRFKRLRKSNKRGGGGDAVQRMQWTVEGVQTGLSKFASHIQCDKATTRSIYASQHEHTPLVGASCVHRCRAFCHCTLAW